MLEHGRGRRLLIIYFPDLVRFQGQLALLAFNFFERLPENQQGSRESQPLLSAATAAATAAGTAAVHGSKIPNKNSMHTENNGSLKQTNTTGVEQQNRSYDKEEILKLYTRSKYNDKEKTINIYSKKCLIQIRERTN